jgi:hypothetical protein
VLPLLAFPHQGSRLGLRARHIPTALALRMPDRLAALSVPKWRQREMTAGCLLGSSCRSSKPATMALRRGDTPFLWPARRLVPAVAPSEALTDVDANLDRMRNVGN